MISNDTPVDETASELPASAFPEGVDPSTYIASLKGETPEATSTTARPHCAAPGPLAQIWGCG